MLDFICMGSADMLGKERERKIQNENTICLHQDSNPGHATPRQVSQGFRPLGHGALMMISGLMTYRIMGYKLINPYVTTRVKLIMVTCVFELNVRINLHFLSQCRFYLV